MKETLNFIGQVIYQDLFTGYGIYSLIYIVCSFTGIKKTFLEAVDQSAGKLIVTAGILYFLIYILLTGLALWDDPNGAMMNRLTGPYWFGYWLQLVIWTIASQLLWWDRVRRIKGIRLMISLLFLISFERYVILVTSLHRDYLPSDWEGPSIGEVLTGLFIKGMLIALIAYLIRLIRLRRKKTVKNQSV